MTRFLLALLYFETTNHHLLVIFGTEIVYIMKLNFDLAYHCLTRMNSVTVHVYLLMNLKLVTQKFN